MSKAKSPRRTRRAPLPPRGERRTRGIHVKLTASEFNELSNDCREAGKAWSDFLRGRLLTAKEAA